jgi:hypothetical protein
MTHATCFKSGNPPNAVAPNLGGFWDLKVPQNGGFRLRRERSAERGRMQSDGYFSDILLG